MFKDGETYAFCCLVDGKKKSVIFQGFEGCIAAAKELEKIKNNIEISSLKIELIEKTSK